MSCQAHSTIVCLPLKTPIRPVSALHARARMLQKAPGLVGNAGELALVARDPCSWGACGGGGDVRGQLRLRAGAGGPAALAVSFGALGCFG